MTTDLAPPNGQTATGPLPFQARLNFVLIEPVNRRNLKIDLPEGAALGDIPMGIVRSIGPGYHTENGTWVPTELKVGQTVCLAFPDTTLRGLGQMKVTLNGKPYLLVHEGEIAGVVPEAV